MCGSNYSLMINVKKLDMDAKDFSKKFQIIQRYLLYGFRDICWCIADELDRTAMKQAILNMLQDIGIPITLANLYIVHLFYEEVKSRWL